MKIKNKVQGQGWGVFLHKKRLFDHSFYTIVITEQEALDIVESLRLNGIKTVARPVTVTWEEVA